MHVVWNAEAAMRCNESVTAQACRVLLGFGNPHASHSKHDIAVHVIMAMVHAGAPSRIMACNWSESVHLLTVLTAHASTTA